MLNPVIVFVIHAIVALSLSVLAFFIGTQRPIPLPQVVGIVMGVVAVGVIVYHSYLLSVKSKKEVKEGFGGCPCAA
jgi:hypothetical protein